MAFLLPFLGKYWMQIGLAILVGLALAYVSFLKIEVSHYKSKAVAIQTEFDSYKNNVEAMQTALKSSNSALTLQLKQQQVAQNQAQETFKKALTVKVANDEASKHIIVPGSTIRVLNDSTLDPNGSKPTDPDCGNACAPSASQDDITLNEVLGVETENNANHWACITQVTDWQKFWASYVKNVETANAQAH
jgi:hypothetical protein